MKGLLFFIISTCASQVFALPSAHFAGQKNVSQSDSSQLQSLYELSESYYCQAQWDSLKVVIKTLQQLSEQPDHQHYLAKSAYLMKLVDTNAEDGSVNMEQVKVLLTESDSPDIVALVHIGIADAKMSAGQFHDALLHLNLLTDAFQNDELNIATRAIVFNDLSSIYMEFDDHTRAAKYGVLAYDLYKEGNNISGQITSLIKLGEIKRNAEAFEEALSYLDDAIALVQEHGKSDFEWQISSNVGELHADMGNLDQALAKHQSRLDMATQDNDIIKVAVVQKDLARVYIQKQDYANATTWLNKATATIESNDDQADATRLTLLMDTYMFLAQIDSIMGDHQSGLQHYKKYIHFRDQLYTDIKNKAIEKYKVSYETEKKDQEIELLTTNHEVQKLTIDKQRNLMLAILIGSILILALVGLVYNRYKLKTKSFSIIKKQKSDLEHKNEIKEALIKEIHHRVKNNLQIMLSMLNAQGYILEGDEKAKSIIKESQNRIRSLALIHQNLHHSGHYLVVNAKDYIHDLIDNISGSFREKIALVNIKADVEPVEINMNFAVPIGLIINELVTNCFKYAFVQTDNPELSITFKAASKDSFDLSVCDNGIGFPPDFDMSNASNFGLQIVRGLTQQLSGEMTFSHEHGACFYFKLRDQDVVEKETVSQ